MGIKFSNNASANIIQDLTSTATSVSVTVGKGDLFPSLTEGDYFYATLAGNNGLEIVKVTNRVNDTMTIVRAQDDTTALSFDTGDLFELRIVAADFNDTFSEVDDKLEASIEETTSIVNSALSSKAPISHASSSTEFGTGTSTQYGHNKLSDATNSNLGAEGGTAATPLAVKTAKDEAVQAASSALEAFAEGQATKDEEQDAKLAEQDVKIAEALDKVGLPLGFEYTRLTGQTAPLGGVDYMGQTATRAMYADLWAWLNENKSDAIVSESEWQSLYTSQNGNVAKYSSGDGSTTFRFPRVMGHFKGAGSVDELGSYTPEGLPDHTHTRGSMNITGSFQFRRMSAGDSTMFNPDGVFTRSETDVTLSTSFNSDATDRATQQLNFDASRSWTGSTSSASESNPIYGNSNHVTPESVTLIMGVIAIGSVASIGEATEEGIVAELGEHGAKLGELEAEVDEKFSTVVPVGFVMPFAANNTTPNGYLLCNGAAVSRTTYAALFAAIGTTYGTGDGSTTFNLPNLTDKFIQGSGTAGTTKAAGLPNITGTFEPSDGRGGAATGAFYKTSYSGWTEKGTEGTDYTWKFDASRSNAIYGASTTVQPPALTMRYYIKY